MNTLSFGICTLLGLLGTQSFAGVAFENHEESSFLNIDGTPHQAYANMESINLHESARVLLADGSDEHFENDSMCDTDETADDSVWVQPDIETQYFFTNSASTQSVSQIFRLVDSV